MLYRESKLVEVKKTADGTPVMRERACIQIAHEDVIKDTFWNEHPHILNKP